MHNQFPLENRPEFDSSGPWQALSMTTSFYGILFLLVVAVQSMTLPKLKLFKTPQRELLKACKTNDSAKLQKLLHHKNLDLFPCLNVAFRNKSFDVIDLILKDDRLKALGVERLQEIAGLAVHSNHLGAFEAALSHPNWTFAVESFYYMKSIDEFGWSLVYTLWTSGKMQFFEALLRLKWRESQRFIYTSVETDYESRMNATLETFLISDPQVLIADVLYAMHMADEELRALMLEFMHKPAQKRRVYLYLLDTFLRVGGDFDRLKSFERLVIDESSLPKYLALDVAKLKGFGSHTEGLKFAIDCAAKHCKLFNQIMNTIPLVTKGQVKAGALEVMINRLLELNEPIPYIAAQLRTALGLAVLNESILRPLHISDLGPLISSML